MSNFQRVWACSLLLLLLAGGPAWAQQITNGNTQQRVERQSLFTRLARAKVIYLGETHDSEADHRAQLDILQALYQQNSQLAIGLEMFQLPFQGVLDRYIRGELTEVEMLEQSEYNQRWGFPWRLYAPILRFAKEKSLSLVALNTPTEITRKVARSGLESLTPQERKSIPPVAEIDLSNAAYRAQLQEIYTKFHKGSSNSQDFERFWQAQVLWDETMAAAIVAYLKVNPNRQLVVLAGKGHIAEGYGIPSRVARRLGWGKTQPSTQVTILLNPEPDLLKPKMADFFWQTQTP
jgi:uncharacterized iron-regulated protein